MAAPTPTEQPTVYPAVDKHTATVIFCHGMGQSPEEWADTIEDWRQQDELQHIKFILPAAPNRPITWNKGNEMTGWFDIHDAGGTVESFRKFEDTEGVMASRDYIHKILEEEIESGTPSERIVIAGFSQGGAMTILSSLTTEHKLAGIVSLSSWLLRHEEIEELVPEDKPNVDTPIFMAQGTDDRMVKPMLGKQSYDILKKMGHEVTWEVYPDLGHSACMEELEDVQAFIEDQLPVEA